MSSKVHAAVDAAGLPLAFILTPGQAADCPQFKAVLEKIRVRGRVGRPQTRLDAVAADKAYSSRGNRADEATSSHSSPSLPGCPAVGRCQERRGRRSPGGRIQARGSRWRRLCGRWSTNSS
ncbi:transposase [Streptomyces canus]